MRLFLMEKLHPIGGGTDYTKAEFAPRLAMGAPRAGVGPTLRRAHFWPRSLPSHRKPAGGRCPYTQAMRVIGGELGSRRLRAPRGLATRPSSDRLRQALFNILGTAVRGRLFVDAFAGTGAVGIEAWSRGARPVVWIEPDPVAARALRDNLDRLDIIGGSVLQRSLPAGLAALERLLAVRAAGGCDFFFFDPPYADAAAYPAMLGALARRPGLARPGTCIVAETRRGLELPPRCGRLRRERVHPQGDSQLVFYAVEEEPAPGERGAA